jgi:hypothetical protein
MIRGGALWQDRGRECFRNFTRTHPEDTGSFRYRCPGKINGVIRGGALWQERERDCFRNFTRAHPEAGTREHLVFFTQPRKIIGAITSGAFQNECNLMTRSRRITRLYNREIHAPNADSTRGTIQAAERFWQLRLKEGGDERKRKVKERT